MPLVKKNQVNSVTAQNVQINSDLEYQKKAGMTFSGNGLNDESIDGATSIPLTETEKKRLTFDTAKLDTKSETNYNQQVHAHVQTYGLMPPVCDEYLEGQQEIAEYCRSKIWTAIVEHKWYGFFTKMVDGHRVADQEKLQNLVNVATRHSYNLLVELYGYGNLDIATNMSVLSLVDSLFIGDNSGSMTATDSSNQGDTIMSRWNYLKLVAQDDGFIASMFDDDGFEVTLMTPDTKLGRLPGLRDQNEGGRTVKVLPDPKNPDKFAILNEDMSGFRGLTSQEQVEIIFNGVGPDFGTPTAESIERVYNRNVKMQAINGTLAKPLLVRLYTDGNPTGKDVKTTLRQIKSELRKTIYGEHAMLFEIIQTGKVTAVNDWFEDLDNDVEKDAYGRPKDPNNGVGDIIDCVSQYEIELAQVLSKNPGATWFDVPFYKMKCRCGVMIKALDQSDETNVSSVFTKMTGMKLY
jgi:hypothetical protein